MGDSDSDTITIPKKVDFAHVFYLVPLNLFNTDTQMSKLYKMNVDRRAFI
jgi:hypothetical protein